MSMWSESSGAAGALADVTSWASGGERTSFLQTALLVGW